MDNQLSDEVVVNKIEQNKPIDALMLGVTLGRLALLPELVDAIQDSSLTRTSLMVGAVVVADIADGVVARKLSVDSDYRRIADAAVDRVSMVAAFGAAIGQNPDVLAWYAPLAVRGAVIATGSNMCFWLRKKLVLGGNFHKLASLSAGAMGIGLVAEASPKVMVPLAAATYGIGAVSALDYFGAHRKEFRGGKATKLERVKVRKLSGLRSLLNKNGPLVRN